MNDPNKDQPTGVPNDPKKAYIPGSQANVTATSDDTGQGQVKSSAGVTDQGKNQSDKEGLDDQAQTAGKAGTKGG